MMEGFADEFAKIAVSAEGQANREKLKRFLKTTVGAAVGTGLGTGAFMLLEHAAKKTVGPEWARLSPQAKILILGPAMGALTVGGMHLADRLRKEQEKR